MPFSTVSTSWRQVPDLSGDVDPDDAFSSVPYEKGFFFLYYLQSVVGGPAVFDPFFKEYIQAFSFKTLTSEVWMYLRAFPSVVSPGLCLFRRSFESFS